MPRYPNRLHAGSPISVALQRRPELYAVRSSENPSSGAVAVFRDEANKRIAVYEGKPATTAARDEIGPVYSVGESGPLAVPTGRVFVRLEEGLRPSERSARIAAAGFEIESTVSWAPHTAWLRPASGGIAHALAALSRLEKIPGVVHAEPQVLMERALRTRRR